MLRLMLLRHAKSDWSQPGTRDHDRPLNARGRGAAPRIGAYMADEHLVPQHVLVSSARRTRETWALVAGELGKAKPAVAFEDRLYESPPAAILSAIRETPDGVTPLLVVGHNPSMQALAMSLTGAGEKSAMDLIADKYPTGGLAIVDFDLARWSGVGAGKGRLERFVTPRSLAVPRD